MRLQRKWTLPLPVHIPPPRSACPRCCTHSLRRDSRRSEIFTLQRASSPQSVCSYWSIQTESPGTGSSTEAYSGRRPGPPHGGDTHTDPERAEKTRLAELCRSSDMLMFSPLIRQKTFSLLSFDVFALKNDQTNKNVWTLSIHDTFLDHFLTDMIKTVHSLGRGPCSSGEDDSPQGSRSCFHEISDTLEGTFQLIFKSLWITELLLSFFKWLLAVLREFKLHW